MADPTARKEYADLMAALAADVWFEQKYPDRECPARVLRSEFMRGRSIYHRPTAERQVDDLVSQVRAAALAEAATAAEALIPALQREYPEEPSNSPWCCGVKDAAAEIRRIAALPAA